MTRDLQIQERLKELSVEMAAISAAEEITEELSAQYDAFETEADALTLEANELKAEAKRTEMQAKAQSVRDFAKSSSRVTTPNRLSGDGVGRVRLAIADDPSRGFKSLAHFAARVFDAGQSPRADEMLMQVAAGTGMTSSVNSEGGVLMPPAYSKNIWDRVLQQSNSLLQYCDVYNIDPGTESITIPAINETSRANGSRMGGIRGYWKGELSALTESRPQFRDVTLNPKELYVFAFIADKLLRGAPGTATQILERGAAEEIAFKVGDAIVEGSGSGMPVGVVGHASVVSIAKETNQPAATILTANVRKMMARMHPKFASGAVWFVNQDVLPALETLQFEVGVGGVPVMLPPGGLSDSPYARLYGKPVIPIEYCSTLGTVGDIILANLGAYAVGIRGTVDTAYSMHLKFDYAQTAYRVIFEVDGQPWLNSPITPFKGTNTLAPILTLATRA
jgi:HK97 family phage major capsid protein